MADWATLKMDKTLGKVSGNVGMLLLFPVIGFMLARANVFGLYPFAIAFSAILAADKKNRNLLMTLIGVILGLISVRDLAVSLQVLAAIGFCSLVIPKIKAFKGEGIILPLITALATALSGSIFLAATNGLSQSALILVVAQSALAGGFAVIFWCAYLQRECLLKGSFNSEQAMAWFLVLAVCLSGLEGLTIGGVNLQILVLGFFILYIADRFGAGAAAGAGAILGFLLKWNFGVDSLINAGIYGLLGFICGGFAGFGKLGIAVVYSAAVLMISYFVHESFLSVYLYSSALGLLLFVILPGKKKKSTVLKKKVMPEIETTVSKVKTLADIFDQLAFGFQAAGVESKLKPEVPELMNILVDRICKNCPTVKHCWEREFYRTYNFLFDLFSYQEEKMELGETEQKDFPPEWKSYCGKLQELMLAARFILEQQKDKEVWQKRLALNRDALAEQYKNVSQVIGHLAKELYSKHNAEEGKPLVWSRQHRRVLDIGVGTFIKAGNGISGDNFSSVPLSATKSALVLCDGMGVGEEAARMSSAALTILEQLLSTGFEAEGALKALNSILVLRSPEESFVTVDMVILDLEREEARLIKIGAAPTYIIRQDDIEILETSSLPVGILNDIEIPVIDIGFTDETLVLVTDGILDVGSKENDWLKEFLQEVELMSAQELADRIIKEAMRLAKGRPEDDGVVLVVRRRE
ncbi:MAG: SpoIIE family protein phosphatase [Peptococcaceae bacterium]|nr:SpoIIE family protein phosphatase [Peptococcaceae bacterium]